MGFSFDARRWTPREMILGGATLVLMISLFLPWFRVTVFGRRLAEFSGAENGFVWVVFVLGLGVLTVLILRAGLGRVPFAPPPGDRQLLIGATGLNFLLVLLAFLVKPAVRGQFTGSPVQVDWMFGAFVALAVALVAMVAAVMPERSSTGQGVPQQAGRSPAS